MSRDRTSLSITAAIGRETLAAGIMIKDSLFRPNNIPHPKNRNPGVLILPGFIAPKFIYRDLMEFFHSLGLRAGIADYNELGLPSLRRRKKQLISAARQFMKTSGKIDYVIGHSLGGIEAVFLMLLYPEIRKAVCIAAPFNNGQTWEIARIGKYLSLSPHFVLNPLLKQVFEGALKLAERIITIASINDIIVPPDEAALPQARNIVISERSYRGSADQTREKYYDSHTGLPNMKYVRAILQQEFSLI